jgi:hypothetical protein
MGDYPGARRTPDVPGDKWAFRYRNFPGKPGQAAPYFGSLKMLSI